MSELGIVEDTLFVPMAGRIYASEQCPQVLFDKKALELKGMVPPNLLDAGNQSQYTLLASASRSANMDRFIRDFLTRKANGAIVQLGCGLETSFYRSDNAAAQWYALDLPNVIEFRREVLPEPEQEKYLAADAFSSDWIEQIRTELPDAPLLITAGGLFHYFEEEKVLELFKTLSAYGDIEVVFDTVNQRGLDMMRKKYMKQVGHAEAQMFFCVDNVAEFVSCLGAGAKLLVEEPYYKHIPRKGLSLITRISMSVSDAFMMVKMVHVKL